MNAIDNIENIKIINKSKFITNLIYVEDIESIKDNIEVIKNKYKDATHHCYAYVVGNNKRFSDDKEPSGTAGKPILDVLEKNILNNVLCVITRYFGGIKLGASNLLRAYSNSVSDTINNTKIYNLINGYNVILVFDYDILKNIDLILKDINIINKSFDEKIIYNLNIEDDILNKLKKLNIKINVIKKIKMKKI